jgi:hypothetical protein
MSALPTIWATAGLVSISLTVKLRSLWKPNAPTVSHSRRGVESGAVCEERAWKRAHARRFDHAGAPSVPYGIAGINLETPPCQRPEEVV